jgi:hypothetical protein
MNAIKVLGQVPFFGGTVTAGQVTQAKEIRQAVLRLGLVEILDGRQQCLMTGSLSQDLKCPLESYWLHPSVRIKGCETPCPSNVLLCQCHPCSFDQPVQVSALHQGYCMM